MTALKRHEPDPANLLFLGIGIWPRLLQVVAVDSLAGRIGGDHFSKMKKTTPKWHAPRSPTATDAYIGGQIRKRRLALKMHLPQLARR
jgi:hypothetical protein